MKEPFQSPAEAAGTDSLAEIIVARGADIKGGQHNGLDIFVPAAEHDLYLREPAGVGRRAQEPLPKSHAAENCQPLPQSRRGARVAPRLRPDCHVEYCSKNAHSGVIRWRKFLFWPRRARIWRTTPARRSGQQRSAICSSGTI